MDNIEQSANKKNERERTKKNIRNLIIKILVLGIIIYITFGYLFGLAKMKTSYMNPRITEGDLVLFYRLDKNYELQDAVVVEIDGKIQILRIVAKEGQVVDISETGELLIDGYPEEIKPFYKTKKDKNSEIQFPYTVEPNEYFMMNDYRDSKNDSRSFGSINAKKIKGKIFARFQIRNI